MRLRLSSQYPTLEIKSVDGFQGREKEAVVISLVRSNPKGEVGFLAEHRRINVAITRARRHLAVVADSETVGHDDFLKSLMDYMSSYGDVRTAHEYVDDSLPSLDASNLAFENGDAFLSKFTKTNKKREKVSDVNKTDKKVNKDLRIKRSDRRNGTNDLACIAAKVSNEANELDASPSLAEHSVSVEASSCKSRNSNDRFRQARSSNGSLNSKYKQELETIEKEILEFVKDSSKLELQFPKTLNSQQRFDVHCIAEKLKLAHESKGEGTERHIVVRKVIEPTPKGEEKDDELLSTCPLCRKRVPKTNLELHSLRCEQILKSKAAKMEKAECEDSSVPQAALKPPKKSAKPKPSVSKQQGEEDFDKLLASFTKLDSQCAYDACKQSVRTLGQTCQCCKKIYCLSHHIPEVHGCGEEAKRRARYLARNPPRPKPMTSDATRKAQLQRKLDMKLDGLSEKRKAKQKGGKNK